MTRFKELERIGAAIAGQNLRQLVWALRYCRSRRKIAPNPVQRQSWTDLEKRVSAAFERAIDHQYRSVLGSDVPNDGMYVELRDSKDPVVACVFRSDATGRVEISRGPEEAPDEVVEQFVAEATRQLVTRKTPN